MNNNDNTFLRIFQTYKSSILKLQSPYVTEELWFLTTITYYQDCLTTLFDPSGACNFGRTRNGGYCFADSSPSKLALLIVTCSALFHVTPIHTYCLLNFICAQVICFGFPRWITRLGPFQTTVSLFITWPLCQPSEFVNSVMRPAQVRSLPALITRFGWNVNLYASFTSDGSFVPKAINTVIDYY